jgi:hypothetical protein
MTRFERFKESIGFGPKLVPVQPERESYQGFDVIFGNTKYNKSLPKEYYYGRYIWYGKDNLFPQRLNELYESVSLHSAIVDFKKLMICGQGYTIEGEDTLPAVDKVKLAGIKRFIEEETTLQEFIENITLDMIIHSTVYIKLHWNEDKTRLIKCERIEPSKIRLGVDLRYPEKIKKIGRAHV